MLYSYKEINSSHYFNTVNISGICNCSKNTLSNRDCSIEMFEKKDKIPSGNCIYLGIPFVIPNLDNCNSNFLLLHDSPVTLTLPDAIRFKHMVFLHTADFKPPKPDSDGILRPMRGNPILGDQVAEYILKYTDDTECRIPIRRRINIGEPWMLWGEYTFEAVPHGKPHSIRTNSEDVVRNKMPDGWGTSQLRLKPGKGVEKPYFWLYSFENPYNDKMVKAITFVPKGGIVFLFGISYCNLDENPIRWKARKKFLLRIPPGEMFDSNGDYDKVDIDLGSIISINPALDYDNEKWIKNQVSKPLVSDNSLIIEYTAHKDAMFYYGDGFKYKFKLSSLEENYCLGMNELCYQDFHGSKLQNVNIDSVRFMPDASRKVKIKIKEKETGMLIPARIHVRGEKGEYLAPIIRNRIPNPFWLEDFGADFVNEKHFSTYIDGMAEYKLPPGNIYIEVSKGFEIPITRKKMYIDGNVKNIEIELEHILPWREKGWVTADTHVHFLSPQTALFEGAAEGVNVVNLLTTQLGEFFINIGDFDGKTTIGSKEAGGTGEYLVRVGTENRQHILGHISLLGYEGSMILPLTTGGPIESPLGDPVEKTLSEWAIQCKKQNGVVILPHFPEPRGENSAVIVMNNADGVELSSPSDLYGGISAYSLSDWYRYLNCGYKTAAVGGTDKMSASTAVGTIRTYSRIRGKEFTYENWKESLRRGETFVTIGPLIEFSVNGTAMGGTIYMKGTGGNVDIEWEASSVIIPVTSVELVVNGETKEVVRVTQGLTNHKGIFNLSIKKSSWVALRIRGRYEGKMEIIAAHSSPVMIIIDDKFCFNSNDALTILEQIEGVKGYMRNLGTRAEEKILKRLLMNITSAHNELHDRLHMNDVYHNHTIMDHHYKM